MQTDTLIRRERRSNGRPKPSLRAALSDFELAQEAAGRSPRTVEAYRYAVGRLCRFAERERVRTVDAVDAELLRRWLVSLQAEVSPETVAYCHRHAKGFYSWLLREGVLEVNPFTRVPSPKRPQTVKSCLAPREVKKLLGECSDARDKALLLFFLDTGVRLQEAAGLRVQDVDVTNGSALVTGKGNRQRLVFLGPTATRALRRYLTARPELQPSDFLWQGQRGPLGRDGIRFVLRRLERRSGVDVSPHKLRRTAAVSLLRAGADIRSTQLLLGHSDVQTLCTHYLPLVTADLAATHRRCSPADWLSGVKNGR